MRITELEREALLEALEKIALSRPIEIKFTDRVKAISLLLEALGGGEDGMAALLDALDGESEAEMNPYGEMSGNG